MKRKVAFWLILIIIVGITSIFFYLRLIRGNNNKITGVIKYFDLEGGFYGIIGDNGKNYLPVNLSSEFKIDGLKIKFTYKKVEDSIDIFMWGTPIELVKIEIF